MPADTRTVRVSCSLGIHENCVGGKDWFCECSCHFGVKGPDFAPENLYLLVTTFNYETWLATQAFPEHFRKTRFDSMQPKLYHGFVELCKRSGREMTPEEGVAYMQSLEVIALQDDYNLSRNNELLAEKGLSFKL